MPHVPTSALTAPPRVSIVRWILGSLSRHRDLLWQMVSTDLRGRYVGSALGLFWTVIHPLFTILIYTLVFSHMMANRLPGNGDAYAFSIYLCSALLPWMAFQDVVMRSTTVFPDNAALVRKVAFPKTILYGFVALSSAINFALAALVFVVVLLAAGHPFPATTPLWVALTVLQLAFGLGVGIAMSVLHVFLRDTAQVLSVLFQFWFWLTPIVYVESILPASLQRLERLNPMYLFVSAHRALVLEGHLPSALHVLALVALAGGSLVAGTLVYRRFRAEMLDEL
jgi:lipopolysaccharide transport system permease protein